MSDQNTLSYNHLTAEPKWQAAWEKQGLFQDSLTKFQQKKENGQTLNPLYLLFAFAYPSGVGLHVGHVESKTALDILARFNRMKGKDVFFPVGWDAFGLPAENYAIKTGVPPVETTQQAITTFRRQIKRLGISYDWANEVATCHPEYYRWTQWLFKQLYEQDLAYKNIGMVNWCPSCQTVLANEQVVDGLCERCDSEVEQKELEQWYFKITQYQDELIEGLQTVDWPEPTKNQQLHWIGKSKGVEVSFNLNMADVDPQISNQPNHPPRLTCFTTRIDTIFGVSFVVISPEKFKELQLEKLVPNSNLPAVTGYLTQAFKKTEEERRIGEKDKTGVDTGLTVINPVSQEKIPVFIADYVLGHVGTGIVMGVPAHDERDWQFALKFELPIRPVVAPSDDQVLINGKACLYNHQQPQVCTSSYGVLINSDASLVGGKNYNGLTSQEAQQQLVLDFPEVMRATTNYKLRDWLISRQRYWGAPIPVIYDPAGEPHLVKDKDLPWLLPTDVDFKPTGESPLKSSQEFLHRTRQYAAREFAQLIKKQGWAETGEGWLPEFDTMDTFVDSSWYYLRFLDARNSDQFAQKENLKQFMPVDFYLIGPEHIVLHLLYSRFFTKFLRDQGYLDLPSGEPFAKMRHQGMILGPNHKKMSKSKGNVINPDVIVEKYGADTLRVYEMFMGPLEADKPWDDRAVQGVFRFLHKLYDLIVTSLSLPEPKNSQPELEQKLHAVIKKVSLDLPEYKFNTAIASMMELSNDWKKVRAEQYSGDYQHSALLTRQDLYKLIKLLAPLAPFMAEELWQIAQTEQNLKLDNSSIHLQTWPEYDEQLAQTDTIVIPIQVNGKLRGELHIASAEIEKLAEDDIFELAKQVESVKPWLLDDRGKNLTIKKEIYVPKKIVSLVI